MEVINSLFAFCSSEELCELQFPTRLDQTQNPFSLTDNECRMGHTLVTEGRSDGKAGPLAGRSGSAKASFVFYDERRWSGTKDDKEKPILLPG